MLNTNFAAKKVFAGTFAAASLFLTPLALTLGSLTATAQPALAQSALPAAAATGTYDIDKPHSDIAFTVIHMGLTRVHGKFDDFDGTVKVDAKKPESSSVAFTIKTDSINTSNDKRDAHLKTPDFFDTAKYPEITFKSTKIAKKGKGFVATGTFTLHGVSKTITLPFTVIGPVKGLEGGTHIGVETSTTIKRSDYGMNKYPGVVGDAVAITIELDLVKQGSIPPAPAAK